MKKKQKERIGFIGLGIMGKPMALNLLIAGYPLTVYDINKKPVVELEDNGAKSATSPKKVAEKSDIVISILPDTPHVENVVLGKEGIVKGVRKGILYIDMSSINSTMEKKISQQLDKKNVLALDAPVSGGQPGAEKGVLSIMVGGKKEAFERALPLFKILGSNIVHIGENGTGQIAKSCNQIATALATQGVIEALTLAKKAGIDTAKLRQAMLGGFAQSKALEISGEKMINRNFEPGFKIGLYRKDLRIGLQTAQELSVPIPGTSLVASEMDALIAKGKSDFDFSILIELIEQLSGI